MWGLPVLIEPMDRNPKNWAFRRREQFGRSHWRSLPKGDKVIWVNGAECKGLLHKNQKELQKWMERDTQAKHTSYQPHAWSCWRLRGCISWVGEGHPWSWRRVCWSISWVAEDHFWTGCRIPGIACIAEGFKKRGSCSSLPVYRHCQHSKDWERQRVWRFKKVKGSCE